jgi:hypothetical protein
MSFDPSKAWMREKKAQIFLPGAAAGAMDTAGTWVLGIP